MKKVLIVEDEAVIRDAFTLLLEANNYAVTAVANGVEALEACEREAFSLILLDLMMPELDGVGFLEQAELDRRSPETKVVVLSNLSIGTEVARAKELGAVRHEIKSNLAPREVIELVEAVMKEEAPRG